MRTSFWIVGALVAAALGWFTSNSANTAPPAAPTKGTPAAERDELAARLQQRVSLEKLDDRPQLDEVLEFVGKKFELTLTVDRVSFSPDADGEEVLKRIVRLPALKNVRLETVLKMIADQVDGVFLVQADRVELVSVSRAVTLTQPPLKHYEADESDGVNPESANSRVRAVPLVHAHFKDVPLQDALRDIETRTNRTVILAALVNDQAKTPVTARFVNVPVDTAVAALAESVGLSAARRGNVYVVTTAERAKAFDPPPVMPFGLLNPGALPFGWNGFSDPTIEELKKKVADLEKTIAESKQAKK